MNKIYVAIILVLLVNCIGFSQEYYSKIIPFTQGAPHISKLYKKDNFYYLPLNYSGSTSTLLVIDETFNIRKSIELQNFNFAGYPLSFLQDEIYFYGSDSTLFKGLRYGKLRQDSTLIYKVDHPNVGDNPKTIINDGENIYCSFSHKSIDNTGPRYAVNKVDSQGKEIWSKNFNQEFRASYFSDMKLSKSNNVLISSGVSLNDNSGIVGHIINIDTSGNTLWTYQGKDYFDGNGPARIIELPNNQLVQYYHVNKRDDEQHIQNEWYPYPWRMTWIDDSGEKLFHVTSRTSRDIIPRYLELVVGSGDYFFGIGYFRDNQESSYTYGYITKFKLNGRKIWSKRYFLPEFGIEDYYYVFRDLIEDANGKLTILGSIDGLNEDRKIWIFNVDSKGNCIEDLCEEITVIDHFNSTIETEASQWSISPTLVDDFLTISSETFLPRFTYIIRDYTGRKIMQGTIKASFGETINISSMPSGNYLLTLHNDGVTSSKKFLKK